MEGCPSAGRSDLQTRGCRLAAHGGETVRKEGILAMSFTDDGSVITGQVEEVEEVRRSASIFDDGTGQEGNLGESGMLLTHQENEAHKEWCEFWCITHIEACGNFSYIGRSCSMCGRQCTGRRPFGKTRKHDKYTWKRQFY